MIGIQLVWVIGFVLAINYAWNYSLKHFTGVGV
jgi:hypothetical protein